MLLLGSQGGGFRGSRAKSGLGGSYQTTGKIVDSMGVLSKGYKKRRPWGVGETAHHKACWGSHIKNLNLLVTLWAVI